MPQPGDRDPEKDDGEDRRSRRRGLARFTPWQAQEESELCKPQKAEAYLGEYSQLASRFCGGSPEHQAGNAMKWEVGKTQSLNV